MPALFICRIIELSENLLGGLVTSVVRVGSPSNAHAEPIMNPDAGGFVSTLDIYLENTASHPACVLQLDVPKSGRSKSSHDMTTRLLCLTESDI